MAEVTFALLTYNQEKFVREAVKSVLQQDYSPLEIVICDDCSTDRTFDILKEEVDKYGGPHQVTLYRNETNLGMGNNQTLAERANGQFIILGHGDDISLPHRTRALVEAWKAQGCSLLSSNAKLINGKGEDIGVLLEEGEDSSITLEDLLGPWTRNRLGAALAFETELLLKFPGMIKERFPAGTDHILPLRAIILKGAYYLHEQLLDYRLHETNTARRMVDNTHEPFIAEEGYHSLDLVLNCTMLEDVDHFLEAEGESEKVLSIRDKLRERHFRISYTIREIRNNLYNIGFRPTWEHKKVLDARPVKGHVDEWWTGVRPKMSWREIIYDSKIVHRLRPTVFWQLLRRLRSVYSRR